MKKIFSILALLLFSSQVAFVSAASDNCKSYAYGYMSDGKIYMMLTNRKYGPFDDIDQLKFTLERLGPQFQANLKQYMYLDKNGGPDKYLVFQQELGDCNPYNLDMETISLWNAKVTNLFKTLNTRFAGNSWGYKTALTNAIAKVDAKISAKQGNAKTLEILHLIRDRFAARVKSL